MSFWKKSEDPWDIDPTAPRSPSVWARPSRVRPIIRASIPLAPAACSAPPAVLPSCWGWTPRKSPTHWVLPAVRPPVCWSGKHRVHGPSAIRPVIPPCAALSAPSWLRMAIPLCRILQHMELPIAPERDHKEHQSHDHRCADIPCSDPANPQSHHYLSPTMLSLPAPFFNRHTL